MPRRDTPSHTLDQLQRETDWVWGHCKDRRTCGLQRPLKIAVYIERWGPKAPVEAIRQRSRCTRCGRLGITLQTPSWAGLGKGRARFPEEWRDPERPVVRQAGGYEAAAEDQIDW